MIPMSWAASLTAQTPMNNPADLALLDTNVLVYADQRKSRYHQAAKAIRDRAQQGEISACISPQNLAEFFTFMTRKGGRGLEQPLDSEEAADEVRKYLDSEHIMMIFPTPATWPLLLDSLLKERPTAGLAIHDLHLAATMLSNGVKKIYTFNAKHFSSLSEIEAILPPEPESESEPSPEPDAPLT